MSWQSITAHINRKSILEICFQPTVWIHIWPYMWASRILQPPSGKLSLVSGNPYRWRGRAWGSTVRTYSSLQVSGACPSANCGEFWMKQLWPNLWYYPNIQVCLEEFRKDLSQDRLPPGQNQDPEYLEIKAAVRSTQPWRSVICCSCLWRQMVTNDYGSHSAEHHDFCARIWSIQTLEAKLCHEKLSSLCNSMLQSVTYVQIKRGSVINKIRIPHPCAFQSPPLCVSSNLHSLSFFVFSVCYPSWR
jgi:hypothetical protein